MIKKLDIPANVTLVAVSKTKPIELVKEAYASGYRVFGENHVQEIVEKFGSWKPEDIEVHMIGHLQSNKVSKVVEIADMIQSVDSELILRKINASCEKIHKIMPVLLEVNTSGEESKSGFTEFEEVKHCVEASRELKNVKIKGLMTVGPLKSDPRKAFALLKKMRDELSLLYSETDFGILSMGMSGDWKVAVEEGSNMVRIGTAIFGDRNYV